MLVETFSYKDKDELAANTYIISDKDKNAVVIDPSVDYDGIGDYLDSHKLKLRAILLTHGHFDHIRGVNKLDKRYEVPIFIHHFDKELLTDSYKNCSDDFREKIIVNATPMLVIDGETIDALNESIIVIHTPYHTKGSCCFYIEKENILFSGDSLFKLTIGRDDLPTSVPSSKKNSLAKIISLPKEVKVYPGHGASTTIGNEVAFNRFINR